MTRSPAHNFQYGYSDSPEELSFITIGLITALPTEYAAVTAILDEEYGRPSGFRKPSSDYNVYAWGRIGSHNVVVASFPKRNYGKVAAADVARLMVSAFPSIRVGLLVGIGGGVPQPQQGRDIRLGDVVVSTPTGTTGGVVQYDIGKEENSFRRTGSLGEPPQSLLSAMGALEAEHKRRRKSNIPTIMANALDRNPGMAEDVDDPAYTYQGFENDFLFQSWYKHPDGHPDCTNCDSREMIGRMQRPGNTPKIHYGLIASGDRVIKNAQRRDEIAEKLQHEIGDKCMCFEMEAAGLMNNFPCLVIRGISDYSDSHKNDRWQNYAAMTAAAYAKELLDVAQSDEVADAQEAREIIGEIHSS